MARASAGLLTTAGSTTLPVAALIGSAGVIPRIREIGVFNTTAVAVALKLVRLSGAGAGTPGTAATSSATNLDPSPIVASLKNTYSFVWTFEDWDLVITGAANAGIGILVDNGTGQALQTYWKWAE
jgi:hypothetical protein